MALVELALAVVVHVVPTEHFNFLQTVDAEVEPPFEELAHSRLVLVVLSVDVEHHVVLQKALRALLNQTCELAEQNFDGYLIPVDNLGYFVLGDGGRSVVLKEEVAHIELLLAAVREQVHVAGVGRPGVCRVDQSDFEGCLQLLVLGGSPRPLANERVLRFGSDAEYVRNGVDGGLLAEVDVVVVVELVLHVRD
eukprot:CAMPEP_0116936802 /NCGR_PEP_ID=MMETSP0467-20121206/31114_1 /TAXON_ID=283647 /ORGANISM="Mesodinium pulex, Strain SPMC105" /LENGTH=193 /DNA_ID=CAMNT_0004618473 /DNA_START=623 /DNA_END=1203 /DNA_ORIENTATION=+